MYRKILCMCAALACAHGWAQDVPTLDEVVVTATRVDSSVLDSPSSVSVISAQEIADSGATDVAQVINGQPGVVVNDYGPQGATKTVSLRGSTSTEVVVLLDGVRLNSSKDGAVDLSSIPMEIIDHIEIVRGGESALYGTGAIGGVINIITRKGGKPQVSLTVTNGSYIPRDAVTVTQTFPSVSASSSPSNALDLADGQNVDLSLSGKVGEVALSAGGSFARAANAFTWFDPLIVNGWRRMANADTLSGGGYAGLDAPLAGGLLSGKVLFDAANTGAPYKVTSPDLTARQSDTAASASLSWKTDRFLVDTLTLDMKAFYRYDQLGFDDPLYSTTSLHRTNTGSFDVTQKWTVSDVLAAIYGGNASYDSVNSTNYTSMKQRLNLAGFLSLPVSPAEGLTLTPTVRYDYYSDFPGSLSYSLSAVLLLGEQSSLRASFGSAYRVPTMDELYWQDPYLAGNPNLKPETSYSGEVGWSWQSSRLSMDASVFTRLLLDGISSIWPYDAGSGLYSPVNISQSLLPGAEVRGKVALSDRISLEAAYTFIYSLVLQYAGASYSASDNLRVPFVPMHSVSATARYTGPVIGFSAGVQYVGEKFTDISNTESLALPGYFLANADLRVTASANIAFTLALKNIFNALYYTQSGYPMPPFSLVTGVSVKL